VPSASPLSVRGVSGGYGSTRVLFDVDLDVQERQCVALLGLNGAGKTTLMNTIMGELRAWSGVVRVRGEDVTPLTTDAIVRRGVGYVPQEQAVFAGLTVRDNLVLASLLKRREAEAGMERVLAIFPKLGARMRQAAGTLSGGERKMLAIGRALLGDPQVLILDEPTEGVWPAVVEEIAERLAEFSAERSVLIVEQHLELALRLADHVYVLDRGRVAASGTTSAIRADPQALSFLTPSGVPEEGAERSGNAPSQGAALI
jgi:branched-chain amino acid transport system ATP-binding protein